MKRYPALPAIFCFLLLMQNFVAIAQTQNSESFLPFEQSVFEMESLEPPDFYCGFKRQTVPIQMNPNLLAITFEDGITEQFAADLLKKTKFFKKLATGDYGDWMKLRGRKTVVCQFKVPHSKESVYAITSGLASIPGIFSANPIYRHCGVRDTILSDNFYITVSSQTSKRLVSEMLAREFLKVLYCQEYPEIFQRGYRVQLTKESIVRDGENSLKKANRFNDLPFVL